MENKNINVTVMFPYPSSDVLQRECSSCEKLINYSCHSNFKLAQKRNSYCRKCYLKNKENKNKKGLLEVLLEGSNESFYWLGFLLADGHFYTKGAVKCTLSIKDEEHLNKLAKFFQTDSVKYNKEKTNCTIKLMNKKVINFIAEKFNISNQKTYFPPNVKNYGLDENSLKSLICGFIDGDGCIAKKNKGFSLTVKCHKSWLDNLDFFAKTLNPTSKASINSYGYAYFTISNYKSLIDIKQKALSLNLPIMERKWEKIQMDYIVNKNMNDLRLSKFKKLYSELIEIPYYAEKIQQFIK